MKKIKQYMVVLVLVMLSVFIVGCGDDNSVSGNNKGGKPNEQGNVEKENNENEADPPEEITIRWAYQWGEDHFNENVLDKVKDEFPHITFEVQDAGTDHSETLEDLISAKKSPDIVSVGTIEHLYVLQRLGLDYNMDELIEETGFELDRIEPFLITNARRQDPYKEDGLYGIPNSRPTYVLHYDKNIFDKFGVEYPVDGMTWEEVLDLAREVTREVDGVQYRGLDLDGWYASFGQFSENTVDPETNEVVIDQSEAVKRFIQYIGDVFAIPGNYETDDNPSSMLHHWGGLLGDFNIAMQPNSTNWGYITENDNIDIVTYPVWEGYEGIDPLPHGGAWSITNTNEHKEETLKVLEYLLSDEVQLEASKNGVPPILNNQEMYDAFAENKPELADKNLEALFKNTPATGPEKRPEYSDGLMWRAGVDFVDSGKDVNDYIRVLQEEAEESVREQMEKD